MKSLELIVRNFLLVASLFAFFLSINTNDAFSKPQSTSEDDTLKVKAQLETKIILLKKTVKELNDLIEINSPEDISPKAVDNWYKQTAWLIGSRNVIEEYYIDLNIFLDYLEHESSKSTEKEIHLRELEFKSGVYDFIKEGKEFIGLTIAASERQKKALEMLWKF